jgi:hypothetical protein
LEDRAGFAAGIWIHGTAAAATRDVPPRANRRKVPEINEFKGLDRHSPYQ